MSTHFGSEPATAIFTEDEGDDWTPRVPPRAVSTSELDSPLLLLPGQSGSRLISMSENGDGWTVEADDLPLWATDAVYTRGSLLLVGAVSGEIHFESRAIAL